MPTVGVLTRIVDDDDVVDEVARISPTQLARVLAAL